jgi:cysteine synthase A
MGLHRDILGLIGNTPLVRINRLTGRGDAEVWAKIEGMNPGGSVKDRIARSMIRAAEGEGRLKPGGAIVEATSGNTGLGLALVSAVRGYRLIIAMPDTMSAERRQLLHAFGAEVELTPGEQGMMGAVEKAESMLRENPNCFMPLQFENPANPEAHRKTTAPEIMVALGGVPDAFVAGVGTGGTITGVGEVLRARRNDVRICAVEPAYSAVLSGGEPGKHGIAGLGAGFYPGVLNTRIYDEVIPVTDEDAEATAGRLSREEGLLCGVSSGAAMWAALRVARELGGGRRVVVVLPDRGERYFSTGLFLPELP